MTKAALTFGIMFITALGFTKIAQLQISQQQDQQEQQYQQPLTQ